MGEITSCTDLQGSNGIFEKGGIKENTKRGSELDSTIATKKFIDEFTGVSR